MKLQVIRDGKVIGIVKVRKVSEFSSEIYPVDKKIEFDFDDIVRILPPPKKIKKPKKKKLLKRKKLLKKLL
jgi:hypothetical protein